DPRRRRSPRHRAADPRGRRSRRGRARHRRRDRRRDRRGSVKRVVVGPRAVAEALRAHAAEVHAVYVQTDARKALAELAADADRRGVKVESKSREELDALAHGHRHQGVVAVSGTYPYADLDSVLARAQTPLLVALDEITDPHNFGAIVRSAVA